MLDILEENIGNVKSAMKVFFCMLVFLLHVSCDPGYTVIISNKYPKKIQIITKPPIESHFATQKGSVYDSVMLFKKNQSNYFGIYEIPSNKKLFLFGSIGKKPSRYVPYEEIKVIKNNDTIKINGNNIEEKATSHDKNEYYIEIR